MDFDAIKLKIASPEEILSWSHGEITKPETINYRTQRPEKDGLFSEKIFGPTKDWECYCGKYRKIRYKGIVCDKCGVEVTRSIVRRERFGHIKLATPIAHIWFLRNVPSKISLFLDLPVSKVEKIIYYATYIVTSVNEKNKERALNEIETEFKSRKKSLKKDSGNIENLKLALGQTKEVLSALKVGQILNETEYFNLAKRFGDVFEAGSGAGAIRKILEGIDLKPLLQQIEKELKKSEDQLSETRLLRRLQLVKNMLRESMRPEWLVLTVLPVLPPDLRPMVALDGGRYATSDLNDLYRRVINRNNRLKRLLELKAPEVIITNEKRMLQEAVDSLIDNSVRLGVQQLSTQRRPLKSLADMLRGKQGRFRQNLLGKRVDYSGRSVIVIGPELKLDQCGLPKKMALEIFKPFVISKILERGLSYNIRNANRLIEQAPPEVWAILEEVIANKKVLLNRAPTLHRLGVQAFQPLLIEDLAIRIPPMVCAAFNADFDGDQMAVHLPLSDEAQREASEKMLSTFNLLKPATGDPITIPTQDIILGCYFLTKIKEGSKGAGLLFSGEEEAMLAYENNLVEINALIKINKNQPPQKLETSVGRLIFNNVLPKDFGFVNESLNKKALSNIIAIVINKYGMENAKQILDGVKEVGFEYATRSGITWGMDDLVTPSQKDEIIKQSEKEVALAREQFEQGLLTNSERRARVISIWDKARSSIAKLVPLALPLYGSVYSIIDSGARGSWSQPVQMTGMKGLVQNPKGETIELPVKSSLKEGFSVLEYFISTHGARKGATDTALKTASAGYLTRRLIDVSQDLIIREKDCGVKIGIEAVRSDGKEFGQPFSSRLFSRTSLEDIKIGRKAIVKAGEIIDREAAELIDRAGIDVVKIRSPITCKTLYGVCSKCYGFDLGDNHPIKIGEAVGIIAAQSIGEPGTQLTMRTFHTGGIAGADITHGLPRVEEIFESRSPKGKASMAETDGIVESIEERGLIKIIKIKSAKSRSNKGKIIEYTISPLAEIFVKVKDRVKKGERLCSGNLDLKELFRFKGSESVQRYVLNEVQRIYASEGASINNKHLEIIIRQMFSRVKIKDAGDTNFIIGEIIEKSKFFEVNRQIKQLNGEPAKGVQLLMGITRVALSTESFLSAVSFQETTKVLVNAAIAGKIDTLRGLKENVIIGRLIPAGSQLEGEEPKSLDRSSVEEAPQEQEQEGL